MQKHTWLDQDQLERLHRPYKCVYPVYPPVIPYLVFQDPDRHLPSRGSVGRRGASRRSQRCVAGLDRRGSCNVRSRGGVFGRVSRWHPCHGERHGRAVRNVMRYRQPCRSGKAPQLLSFARLATSRRMSAFRRMSPFAPDECLPLPPTNASLRLRRMPLCATDECLPLPPTNISLCLRRMPLFGTTKQKGPQLRGAGTRRTLPSCGGAASEGQDSHGQDGVATAPGNF